MQEPAGALLLFKLSLAKLERVAIESCSAVRFNRIASVNCQVSANEPLPVTCSAAGATVDSLAADLSGLVSNCWHLYFDKASKVCVQKDGPGSVLA